ncbi:MAG: TetR/AcrR family transcriptional regulator [Clostridiales bacterium]|nr:TetR/AcrR family transcriptional regulator [Clostridiales bacterium]
MPRSREQNEKIREESKRNILLKSVPFFARNGVEGTTIGNLTKGIKIAQGSIYVYFNSKEELYRESKEFAQKVVASEELLKISEMDVPAIRKLRYVSDLILKKIAEEKSYVYYMILATTDLATGRAREGDAMFEMMRDIIRKGQKDGSFARGDAGKIAEYYWSVVYILCVKRCNDPKCAMLNSSELERVVIG